MGYVGDNHVSFLGCLVGSLKTGDYDNIQSTLSQLLGQCFASSAIRVKENDPGGASVIHHIPWVSRAAREGESPACRMRSWAASIS